jgi:formylglycine-generating enzyme required for sulfatase activity
VETVSWNDVRDWINGLKQLTGKSYALPTEAQWEYAVRATTTTAWPFAESYDYSVDPGQVIGSGFNSNLDAMGWYTFNNTTQYATGTKPVARKQANKWGLYDMQGNVFEWCSDWYDAYPGGSVTNPTGPSTGSDRVGRGGSWGGIARHARSAIRYRFTPGYRIDFLGFRLVFASGQ